MSQIKTYRENGAIGAILDEYGKALEELIDVIKDVSSSELIQIIDNETNDKDCHSVQTILTHTVQSGYTYALEVRKWLGERIEYKNQQLFYTVKEYEIALKEMFNFNEQLFVDYPEITLEEFDNDKKMKVRWGQNYDVEQLFEHAIVHILRHRRQIERFKLKLISKPPASEV